MSEAEHQVIAAAGPDTAVRGRCFLDVTPEIVHMIAGELPRPSRVAFSLTCRGVFAALSRTRAVGKLSQREMLEALRLLERDAPNHFLCFGCLRLCPWKPRNGRRWRGQAHTRCGGHVKLTSVKYRARGHSHPYCPVLIGGTYPLWCTSSRLSAPRLAWEPRAEGPAIFFSEAYQVMNRHRLGQPFGLPLEALEQRLYCERYLTLDDDEVVVDHFSLLGVAHGRRPMTRNCRDRVTATPPASLEPGAGGGLLQEPCQDAQLWKFYHEDKAKIINGELYIRRLHRLTGPPVETWEFAKLLFDLALPVCRHLFSRRTPALAQEFNPFRSHDARTATHLPGMSYIPRFYFSAGDPFVGSCVHCFTDYAVRITEAVDGERGWELELATYHRLGSCSSPADLVWSALASVTPTIQSVRHYRLHTQTSRGEYIYGPGGVRQRWYGDEPCSKHSAGKWAKCDQDSFPFHWHRNITIEEWRG